MTNDLRRKSFIFTLLLAATLVLYSSVGYSCPLMQCAPIITKCQLIDACRCEATLNYTCSKACSHCLGDLYSECCSCVGVCSSDDESEKVLESHVKLFESTNDDLFELFASEEDSLGRWSIHKELQIAPTQASAATNTTTTPIPCTMAFLTSCVDMYKCESSCISMGASGYRWFHPVGCCECVGKYCLNFGVNQVRCRNCPLESEQVIDALSDSL